MAVLVVAQALPGVAGLELTAEWGLAKGVKGGIPANERSLFAGCRVWCLAEIDAAMKHGKNLV
eukprot:SAG22_NODE_10655_length_522_cov_1.442080_1_plen_62_part_10